MRYCRNTFQSKLSKYASITIYPIIAAISLFSGICCTYVVLAEYLMSYSILIMMPIAVASIGIAVWLIDLSVNCYAFENRKYQPTMEGLAVADRYYSLIDWDSIEDILIVAYAASASRQNYETVLVCMLQHRDDDFLQKILGSYLYGVKNRHKFVIIDFSFAVAEELSSFYPREILDLRNEQLHRY